MQKPSPKLQRPLLSSRFPKDNDNDEDPRHPEEEEESSVGHGPGLLDRLAQQSVETSRTKDNDDNWSMTTDGGGGSVSSKALKTGTASSSSSLSLWKRPAAEHNNNNKWGNFLFGSSFKDKVEDASSSSGGGGGGMSSEGGTTSTTTSLLGTSGSSKLILRGGAGAVRAGPLLQAPSSSGGASNWRRSQQPLSGRGPSRGVGRPSRPAPPPCVKRLVRGMWVLVFGSIVYTVTTSVLTLRQEGFLQYMSSSSSSLDEYSMPRKSSSSSSSYYSFWGGNKDDENDENDEEEAWSWNRNQTSSSYSSSPYLGSGNSGGINSNSGYTSNSAYHSFANAYNNANTGGTKGGFLANSNNNNNNNYYAGGNNNNNHYAGGTTRDYNNQDDDDLFDRNFHSNGGGGGGTMWGANNNNNNNNNNNLWGTNNNNNNNMWGTGTNAAHSNAGTFPWNVMTTGMFGGGGAATVQNPGYLAGAPPHLRGGGGMAMGEDANIIAFLKERIIRLEEKVRLFKRHCSGARGDDDDDDDAVDVAPKKKQRRRKKKKKKAVENDDEEEEEEEDDDENDDESKKLSALVQNAKKKVSDGTNKKVTITINGGDDDQEEEEEEDDEDEKDSRRQDGRRDRRLGEQQRQDRAHHRQQQDPPQATRRRLECDAQGGPSLDILQELQMEYWSTIPGDAQGPYSAHDTTSHRYLTFEPSPHGGWDELRMTFEVAYVMARTTGRTLVLPPRDSTKPGTLAIEDAYDFSSAGAGNVRVVSMEHFLRHVALSGQLQAIENNQNGLAVGPPLFPPQNQTQWHRASLLTPLWSYLRQVGLVPPSWNTEESLLVFPTHLPQNQHADLSWWHDMVKGFATPFQPGPSSSSSSYPEESHQGQHRPIPVDAPTEERLREALGDRTKVVLYNAVWHKTPLLHLTMVGGAANGHQMSDKNAAAQVSSLRRLSPFYTALFFQDWQHDLWSKRVVRDELHYSNVIFCGAARILSQLRRLEQQGPLLDGDNDVNVTPQRQRQRRLTTNPSSSSLGEKQEFSKRKRKQQRKKHLYALHIPQSRDMKRYNLLSSVATRTETTQEMVHRMVQDFQVDTTSASTTVPPTLYLANENRPEDDDEAAELVQSLRTVFQVYDVTFFGKVLGNFQPALLSLVDQVVCARGGDWFLGVLFSPSSGLIHRLRGYYQAAVDDDHDNDAFPNSGYYLPPQPFAMNSYPTLPYYARELPTAWRHLNVGLSSSSSSLSTTKHNHHHHNNNNDA